MAAGNNDDAALAAAAGVSVRTVSRWRRAGAPMPKHREPLGKWVERLGQWRQARELAPKPQSPANGTPDPNARDWKSESSRALALTRMHRLAVERGDYMPRQEVLGEWAKRVLSVRTRLLALPSLLAGRCSNKSAEAVWQEADLIVRSVLSEFESEGRHTPNGAAPPASEGAEP